MKEQSFRKLLLIFCLAIVLITVGVMLYYAFGIVKGTFTFYLEGFVESGRAGMTGDIDGIKFGIIPPGGVSKKKMIITNEESYPQRIDIILSGTISEFVVISENYFYLEPNEEKTITFSFIPPDGTSEGKYDGYGKVSFKKI
jgi:hypothetical protein